MKIKFSLSIEESLLEKLKTEAEACGTNVSDIIGVACMAMVDQKALLKHTGGLFKQIGKIVGEGITSKQIIDEVVE
jgi:hypothetical protein